MKQSIFALGFLVAGTAFSQTVNFGGTPLSMDFHSYTAAPMTAAPKYYQDGKWVTVYENDYPYIVNTRYYMEAQFYGADTRGMDLVHKTTEAMTDRFGANSAIVSYMKGEWRQKLQPKGGLGSDQSWFGSCGAYSAVALDPFWQQTFSQIGDGLICSGKPFTKGELKEIVLALYPEPSVRYNGLSNFYTSVADKADVLEDANVALAKLGILGSGDLKPQDVIKLAADAKAQGRSLQMDQDAGVEAWNQPIQSVTDRVAQNTRFDEYESLSASDLSASNLDGALLQSYLLTLETELATHLPRGEGVPVYRFENFCNARKALGLGCDDLNGKLSLTKQVNLLTDLKKAALKSKLLKAKAMDVELREVVITYGIENSFASNKPDQIRTEVYRYTITRDSQTKAVIRSQWAPATRKLKDICRDRGLLKDRVKTSLVADFDAKSCSTNDADAEYFTGSVPPNSISSFRASADFAPLTNSETDKARSRNQQAAYEAFIDMMKNCQSFDGAAKFFRNFEGKIKDNQLSASEAAELRAQFNQVKGLLDADWMKSYFNNKGYISGMSSFRKSINL